MYKNLEILKIYDSVQSIQEFWQVSETFQWLIENKFMEKSMFLCFISLGTFSRIEKLKKS